jgi:hypothetical protein
MVYLILSLIFGTACILFIRYDKREQMWRTLRAGRSIQVQRGDKWCSKQIIDVSDDSIKIQHHKRMTKSEFLSKFDGQRLTL